MAISTHRWRPEIGVKSGYSSNKKYRKLKYSNEKNKCLIELKFENSPYFVGTKFLPNSVYRPSKTSVTTFNRFYTFSKGSENYVINNLDNKLTKKLYVSEYVVAQNINSLSKLNDTHVRSFIISNESLFVEDAISLLEILKLKMDNIDWISYRCILVPKTCDISWEILRKNETSHSTTLKICSNKNVEDDEDNDIDYHDEDDGLTEDSRSTNTTMDEDAEEKMRNRIACNKFRDSRIILANRPKPKHPDIDPVEKCFLALTKMFEDNMFSANKGLTEVNTEITNLTKITLVESADRISNDSIDIHFQMG